MTEILPRVRVATHDDEDDLIALLWRLHAENGMRSEHAIGGIVPGCEEKVRGVLRRAFNSVEGKHQGPPAIIGVLGAPGALEGAIYISVEAPWYSNHHVCVELFNVLLPEYRKSRKAELLIDFAKHFSDHMDIHPLFIGIMGGVAEGGRELAKARYYRRFFGQTRGYFFVYEKSAAKQEEIV